MADLGTALTLVGLIIIIFGIYRSIRKKNFKKHILLLVIGIVVLITGGIVTPTTNTASPKKEPTEVTKKEAPKKEPTEVTKKEAPKKEVTEVTKKEAPKKEVKTTIETKNPSKPESKPVVSEVKSETKKETVSEPKSDKPKKKTTESLSSKIKNASDPHFGKLSKIEINDDMGKMDGGKIVLVYIRQDGLTKRTADYNTTRALKEVFSIDKVNEIVYFWQAALVDAKGNETVETIDKIQMSKETAASINWDNFLYTNLDQVADSYNASPVLK